MNDPMLNPDVEQLAAISSNLKSEYVKEGVLDPWAASPFSWIKNRPSRQVGKIGEQLVAAWCSENGLHVAKTGDSQADRLIGGWRMEIKFSTLWAGVFYKFQQIREQNYDYAICLGISPFDAHCWVIPKQILRQYVIGHMGQHTGASGTETAWLEVRPNSPHNWLHPFGGTLEWALAVLKEIAKPIT